MDQGVRPRFQPDQDERYDRQDDLQSFGSLLPRAELAATPLRRGARAQMPNPAENGKVDQRARGGHDEHGNADRILVKAFCRRVNATGRRQGCQSDRHPDAADGQHGRAQALQQCNHQAGATQRPHFPAFAPG